MPLVIAEPARGALDADGAACTMTGRGNGAGTLRPADDPSLANVEGTMYSRRRSVDDFGPRKIDTSSL